MKDYWFIIKVSDLLNNVWRKDLIKIENKYSNNINNLNEWWISWNIFLQSINKSTIVIELQNIVVYLNYNCEICWKNYSNKILVEKYSSKFWIIDNLNNLEKDELCEINKKNETIDIENIIIESIILQEDLIKKCNICKNININDEELIENLNHKITFK